MVVDHHVTQAIHRLAGTEAFLDGGKVLFEPGLVFDKLEHETQFVGGIELNLLHAAVTGLRYLVQAAVQCMLRVIHGNGPWDLILKHHFSSVEEVIATTTGGADVDASKLTMNMFLTPAFRGFFADHGVCHHDELHDVFYNRSRPNHDVLRSASRWRNLLGHCPVVSC